jgi:transcriptional regulator with XRE-family HTH domain
MGNDFSVKEYRQRLGLSQDELASMCGTTVRTVQNWENGGTVIPAIQKLLRLLEKEMISGGNATRVETLDRRIYAVCNYFHVRRPEFEQRSGLPSGWSKLGSISDDDASAIVGAFPSLSRQWLLTGEGAMLVSSGQSSSNNSGIMVNGNIATNSGSVVPDKQFQRIMDEVSEWRTTINDLVKNSQSVNNRLIDLVEKLVIK